MPVFAVLPDHPGSAALADKIKTSVKDGNALKLPNGAWLVSHEGTSRELSDLIGLTDGSTVNGIVFSVGSYWGRQGKDVWEWLQLMQAR